MPTIRRTETERRVLGLSAGLSTPVRSAACVRTTGVSSSPPTIFKPGMNCPCRAAAVGMRRSGSRIKERLGAQQPVASARPVLVSVAGGSCSYAARVVAAGHDP
eukprot:scaffold234505_cov36-Prasinocladus_malaysianus.AAC.1